MEKNCIHCNTLFNIRPYRIQTAKYCSWKCQWAARKGCHNSSTTEFKPNIPRPERQGVHLKPDERIKSQYRSLNKGKEKEHQAIWMRANHMGAIPRGCVVHHINGNKLDNRPENLILLPRSYHTQLHKAVERGDCKLVVT